MAHYGRAFRETNFRIAAIFGLSRHPGWAKAAPQFRSDRILTVTGEGAHLSPKSCPMVGRMGDVGEKAFAVAAPRDGLS
jgi:hypothetical protein